MTSSKPERANGSQNAIGQAMCGFLNDDYLYGVHTMHNGDAKAWRYRYSTGVMQVTAVLSTFVSNHLDLPIFDLTDDHYVLSVGVDDQDHVFIAGNHHDHLSGATSTHLLECTNVSDFTNPASWQASSTTAFDACHSGSGSVNDLYTYHHWERLTSGTLLHFMSQDEASGQGQGRDILGFKRIAGTWSPIVGDGHFATSENGPSNEADRAYIVGVLVEPNGGGMGVDRVHYVGMWRTNDASADSQQAPFYLYSDNLTTWKYKASGGDGTQTMPITWANRGNAEISSAPAISASIMGGVWVDPSTHFPAITVHDGLVADPRVWKRQVWDGTAWASSITSPVLAGNWREVTIAGARWIRAVTTGQVILRKADSPVVTIRIGGEIDTTGGGYDATHCPIWLRLYNRYAINVGNGDTPIVWTWGDLPRSR